MILGTDAVGLEAGPLLQEIDARWLMAYAAAVGESSPVYLDTARAEPIKAHPLFPVCYEWPLAVALRPKLAAPDVNLRGVHATHDLAIHRLPAPGDRLATSARVVGVEQRKPGAYVVTRHETRDALGAPVTTTDYGTLFLGGKTAGPDRWLVAPAPAPEVPDGPPRWEARIPVPPGAAHVYTECARIWNPIHTDRAVATAAGLPDIILHGTATLALAVSALVARDADGDPARVRRIRCRFGAMVFMPSALLLRVGPGVTGPEGEVIGFQVLTERGGPAVRDAVLVLGPSPPPLSPRGRGRGEGQL